MLGTYIGLYLLAIFPKFVDTKNIKYLVLFWAILSLFFGLVGGGSAVLVPLIILIIAKSPFLYFWLRILDTYEDTIFLYIIILLVGGILVELAGGIIGVFIISILRLA